MRGPEEREGPASDASPGDLVWIRRRLWRVRSVHHGAGLARVVVDAASGPGRRTFLLPADRAHPNRRLGLRDVSARRGLAWLAGCAARITPAYTPASAVGAAVDLYPHQLEPALAVLAGTRRVLIADDVGLGKTIQASFIVADTLRRHADARVLLLVPPSLIGQWSGELQGRFGIAALTADTASFNRLRADRPYMASPWQGPGVWLASPDYVKQPHVIEALPHHPFDLLVVDEAHMLAGRSQRRAAIHAIAARARHVVLLTATPHDGDEARYGRLVSIGATGASADRLATFRRHRTAAARRYRNVIVTAGSGLSRVLGVIDRLEQHRPASSRGVLSLICSVFRKRALSSMAAFVTSLDRRQAVIDRTESADDGWEQPGLFAGDLMPDNEWSALAGDSGLPVTQERTWLRRLRHAAAASSGDSKLTRLCTLVRRAREPVVVFTEYRDTLTAMADAMHGLRAITVLHGGLTPAQQAHAIATFLSGRADALLTTDVASQGVNLQHRARWVIHFDLPWTPMRLEQRTGRVDRIGQTRVVHVTDLGVGHPADTALRERMAARASASQTAHRASCARWTRVALELARTFGCQRVLAARWQGPDPVALPRARVEPRLIRRLCGADLRRVTILEIPIVSGTGETIERHLGWLPDGEPASREWLSPPATLLRRARAIRARAQLRRSRERAAGTTSSVSTPTQRGLFDSRDLPGSGSGASDSVDSPAANGECHATNVRIGLIRPLLILEARR